MERYVRELRETNEKLRVAEEALHQKMNSLLYSTVAISMLNSVLVCQSDFDTVVVIVT